MSLGERLISKRKQAGLSQEEVAEKLGVTRQTISKWETDSSTPDFDKVVPICSLYNMSVDELFTGNTTKEKTEKNQEKENKEKRTLYLTISIFIYFLSVIWIMISIPVLNMNPIIASSIFILICGIATCIIVYSNIMYKKEEVKEKEPKVIKQIDKVLSMITLIIYLFISFITMAWHITWIIWLIYALLVEVIKLIYSLRGDFNEE